MIARSRHIPSLDGLRGLAVSVVLIHHFASPIAAPTWSWLKHFASIGWCGVDLFFALSGFLITGILLDSKGSSGYFRNFYMRRVLRIFPLYYAVLAIVFLILPLSTSLGAQWLIDRQWWFWAYSSNIAMSIHGGPMPSADTANLSHLWSLAVEEHFYMVWPLVVFLLPRRALLTACAAIILGTPALRLACILAGINSKAVYVLSPLRADSIVIGALLAILLREGYDHGSIVKYARVLGAVAGVALCVIVGIRGVSQYDPLMQVVGYSCWSVLAVWILVEARADGSRVARIFSSSWLRALGRYSYGIYVYHGLLRPVFAALLPALGPALYLAVACGSSIGIAWLSYEFFEARFLQMKDRYAPVPATGRT